MKSISMISIFFILDDLITRLKRMTSQINVTKRTHSLFGVRKPKLVTVK